MEKATQRIVTTLRYAPPPKRRSSWAATLCLLSAWLCVVVTAACSQTNTPVASVDTEVQTYRHPQWSWEIDYPVGWTLDDSNLDLIYFERGMLVPYYYAEVSVFRFARARSLADSLEAFSDAALEVSRANFGTSHYELVSRVRTTAGSTPAYEVVFRARGDSGNTSIHLQLHILGDIDGYLVDSVVDSLQHLGRATENVWGIARPEQERIIRSFSP